MSVDHERLTALFTEAMDLDADGQRRLLAGVEDPELARELAEMLDADDHIVTALRTAGLKPTDFSGSFRRPPPDVPGYRLLHPLGAGGMGTVYAAEDAATNQQVAIKVLEVAADEALARFRAEAAIMEKLDHPNIARVLAAGDTRSRPYIVMEQIDGVTLDAFVAQRAPGLPERLALFAQICDTLEHAHQCGVIHRDLKPANIMVRRDGTVSIVDFGVARAPGSQGRTQIGDLLGTPLYMSPEQALGRSSEVDARSDIYSLGVILFELVAGRPPYELRGLSVPMAVHAIAKAPPAHLDDPRLDAVCARALAKAPRDRFASAAALAAAVRAC
jgi:non-specific serine/threonine protein kinase/serine/threonine-protein kinase